MANPNVERVYEVLGAYLNGDDETLRRLMDPAAETYSAPGLINAGTYSGFEGFKQWIGNWEEAWSDVNYELGEIVEVDESVLVTPVHVVGRGAASGLEMDIDLGWIFQWRDGRFIRFQVHETVERALERGRELAAES